jgi:FtsP/CotA-like multicopper oxidase with cupredoxin domain
MWMMHYWTINHILSTLENSEVDEDFLLTEINKYLTLNSDSSLIDLCLIALEEVGNELIKTGDYIRPDVSDDVNNPHHATDHATFGTDDLHQNTSIPKEELLSPRLFNIPTDKEPSPSVFTVDDITYDVSTPFTQQLLRLEELGRMDIESANFDSNSLEVPLPTDDGFPVKEELQTFMHTVSSTNLGHVPTKEANIDDVNPWSTKIKEEIDPPDFVEGVAEGRSGGINGAHHKWTEENQPKTISITCQTGVIENDGWRDSLQMHGYTKGEFGEGGLYHKVLNDLPESGTTKGIRPKFHANLPIQKKETLWTFDGTFPPKLLMAKYGEPHILRHYNFLPIKPERNRGFGMHTITTHEHNGPNNGSSDGFAQSFFFPGEYYDYFYTMTLAGHTCKNVEASDPKASIPMEWEEEGVKPLPNKRIAGDWKEVMSTHWFHDHMLDYTAQNVYKGNAAMMNYYSAVDRGNEKIEDGVNLRFPSGTALSWGNRDYDVNLIVMDKAWDNEGQLWFNPFNTNGFLGDKMMVNWILEPYFEVRARRYRFRILNAAVSRFMKFGLVRKFNNLSGSISGPVGSNTSYEAVPFWLIGNCGNIMMHSVKFDGSNGTTKGVLPVQAIAERFDIIIDFGEFEEGDELYFVNVLEHFNGKRPNKEISLHEILGGSYSGDPCVMKFMEFRVKAYDGVDHSVHPSVYEVGKKMMVPIEPLKEEEITNAVQRNFNFVNKEGTTDEWAIETDGGEDFKMDPRRLSAVPMMGATELWYIRNLTANSASHNVHIHYTEGKILLRDDRLPPIWEQFARKDVYRIGGVLDSSDSMLIALTFNDTDRDQYMMHCHNTVHEDAAMLLRYDINGEGCVKSLPCPLPSWQGVKFMETKTVPTFRTGMSKDNIYYNKPERLLKILRTIDKVVPDVETGSYFVNGLGKSLQLAENE